MHPRRAEWGRPRRRRRRRVVRLLPFTGAGHPQGGDTLASEQAGEHPVQHAGGAEPRPIPESAGRVEVQRRVSDEFSPLAEEEPPESTTGFYLVLGVLVAALLLVVTWLSGSAPEAPEAVTNHRFPAARVTRPMPEGLRARTLAPPSRTPGPPLTRGESAPALPGLRSRTSPLPGSTASAGPTPPEPLAHSLPGPAAGQPGPFPPVARGRLGAEPPLASPSSPGATRPPLLPGERGATPWLAPAPGSPGFAPPAGSLPGGAGAPPVAGNPGRPGENRSLHPPALSPLAPSLPTR